MVFVWKDMDAFKNAVAAVKAGRQREAIMHAACIVPVGTYAEVTGKAGLASKHVLLLDGCSGIVTEEDLNG